MNVLLCSLLLFISSTQGDQARNNPYSPKLLNLLPPSGWSLVNQLPDKWELEWHVDEDGLLAILHIYDLDIPTNSSDNLFVYDLNSGMSQLVVVLPLGKPLSSYNLTKQSKFVGLVDGYTYWISRDQYRQWNFNTLRLVDGHSHTQPIDWANFGEFFITCFSKSNSGIYLYLDDRMDYFTVNSGLITKEWSKTIPYYAGNSCNIDSNGNIYFFVQPADDGWMHLLVAYPNGTEPSWAAILPSRINSDPYKPAISTSTSDVYVAADDGEFFWVSGATGKSVEYYNANPSTYFSDFSVTTKNIALTTDGKYLYLLSGQQRDPYTIGPGEFVQASPIIINDDTGLAYAFHGDNYVSVVDPNSRQVIRTDKLCVDGRGFYMFKNAIIVIRSFTDFFVCPLNA